MDFNIHAGMRVLYKNNGQWAVANLPDYGTAEINDKGLWIPIEPLNAKKNEIHYAESNQIFWDAFPIDDFIKDYKEYFMTKEEYINFIESEEFNSHTENAYVSDGEYGYYPISKYNRNWIEKQPFDYVIRGY